MKSTSRIDPAQQPATLADPRWRQVQTRDESADGQFFFAVLTTGIYCRPGCGARTPRPENVRFFPSSAEAERAGYRACRRCHPGAPLTAVRVADKVAELCHWIDAAPAPPTLEALAQRAGWSPSHTHRIFRATTGLTPRAYAAARRAARVREQLVEQPSVTQAIYGAGFSSAGRFYTTSSEVLGMTPRQLRSKGAQLIIRYVVEKCSLGLVLVAVTERGVCAILLGDDGASLEADLRRRFARAHISPADAEFADWVGKVLELIDQPATDVRLPLAIHGTVFQERVWRALQKIEPGTTVSYADLARSLGAPGAARAIAGACANNPIAVAIPCHRVVGSDGDLRGYRWGLERKRALLEREHSGILAATESARSEDNPGTPRRRR